MSKIKVMSELLANKIAAGEVVERIVSIVKELVENSIDANSEEIIIELKESGLREIKITDNGIGMNKEDAELAFQRHATSKIYDDDDLFNITSLGFRGEALPSIASVSDVILNTCYKDDEIGTYLHIKGGKIQEISETSIKQGTTFIITNLFYNTPARLKHLSSSYTEMSLVIDYVNKMALSYPKVRFILKNDEKEILRTSGNGSLLKVINNIYSLDITKKMIPIEGNNLDYSISGYISLPEVTRANRNHISTLVNGRVVKNSYLYKTINEAYSDFKEDSRYPICIIKIECDPTLLDVNIHPSKLDIKFSNIDELTKLIKTTIINSLKDKLLIPSIEIKENNIKNNYTNYSLDISRNDQISEETSLYKTKLNDLVNFNNRDDTSNLEEQVEKETSKITISNQEKIPELYPVGLLLGTYIVCENELGIYLIDQHAAKERINYENIRYLLSHPNNSVIKPLIPYIIELPRNEYLIIKENQNILDELNITVSEFGVSSFRVLSHPTWFTKGKEEEITKKIFEEIINKEKDFSLTKFNDKLAKMVSCKMSIKANTYIDKPSMESLINDLRKCENPYNCPHGRPAIIHFSIYELEKMFKRSI